MSELEKLLRRNELHELRELAIARELAENIFTEWRDLYMANLLGYIRTAKQCKDRNVPVTLPSIDWCNAAVHLLSVTDTELQDYFLRADPAIKDKLVQAVIDDDGITRIDGFFCQLPLL